MNARHNGSKLYATFRYVEEDLETGPKWWGKVLTERTICDDKNAVVATGNSLKSARGQFSSQKGRKIALGRALVEIEPANHKVRHELLGQFIASTHEK